MILTAMALVLAVPQRHSEPDIARPELPGSVPVVALYTRSNLYPGYNQANHPLNVMAEAACDRSGEVSKHIACSW